MLTRIYNKIRRNGSTPTALIMHGNRVICTTDKGVIERAGHYRIIGFYNDRVAEEWLADDLKYMGVNDDSE